MKSLFASLYYMNSEAWVGRNFRDPTIPLFRNNFMGTRGEPL